MSAPNYTEDLPQGAEIVLHEDGRYVPSQVLVQLLKTARSEYDWPAGTISCVSQKNIINLVNSVADRLSELDPNYSHSIIVDVSRWAGNNDKALKEIISASKNEKVEMHNAILQLCSPNVELEGLKSLCKLPGIRLIIASKIFRFCSPLRGAAIDRHASYFFNSLPLGNSGKTTHFVREWSNGKHRSSRLAIYSDRNYMHNLSEYFDRYLPLLNDLACTMNALGKLYDCAATNLEKKWVPADIEMAAYYWWARNGSK